MPDESGIHYTDPFLTPAELREPARRWRGRLTSAVTIWTSGTASDPAGLTISSVLLAEGEPSQLIGLVNDTTDLFEAIVETQAFVVHILDGNKRRLADRFAGLFPSPGGSFADLAVEPSAHGPVLTGLPDRVHCRLNRLEDAGYQRLVIGTIERIEMGDLDDPLVYFRGRYRSLREERS